MNKRPKQINECVQEPLNVLEPCFSTGSLCHTRCVKRSATLPSPDLIVLEVSSHTGKQFLFNHTTLFSTKGLRQKSLCYFTTTTCPACVNPDIQPNPKPSRFCEATAGHFQCERRELARSSWPCDQQGEDNLCATFVGFREMDVENTAFALQPQEQTCNTNTLSLPAKG